MGKTYNPYEDMFPKLTLVVTWPESQKITSYEGFEVNSILINSDAGLDAYGSCAYRVNPKWWDAIRRGKVRELSKEEIEAILESGTWGEDYDFLEDEEEDDDDWT